MSLPRFEMSTIDHKSRAIPLESSALILLLSRHVRLRNIRDEHPSDALLTGMKHTIN
jgi:hypothetical protein